MPSSISITEETQNNFDLESLEKFVNSEDFADVVLWYQMSQWETGETQSYADFKKQAWLSK